jgi:hypothetical protein
MISFREKVAAQSAVDAGAFELKENPVQVRASFNEAGERLKAARLALRETEPLRGSADDAFVAAERRWPR